MADTVPQVRVCLVVTAHNAAETLPRLIASVKGVIDEWFVVDAGSIDGTAEVARTLLDGIPGSVLASVWIDRRTNAEELLSLAAKLPRPTHLLVVDQDAVVQAEPTFHDDLAASDAHCFMVPVRHRLFEHRQPVVLRTGPEWTYGTEGYMRLHAAAPVAIEALDSLMVVAMEDRSDRRALLEEEVQQLLGQLSDVPEASDLSFELALHYRGLERWDDALQAFAETLQAGVDPERAYYCLYQIGVMHQLAGRPAEAAWALTEAMQADPQRMETYHQLGRLLSGQARWEAALVILERGVRLDRRPRGQYPETWVLAWAIDFELAVAQWWTGQREEADVAFRTLLGRPDLPPAYRQACEHNLGIGTPAN